MDLNYWEALPRWMKKRVEYAARRMYLRNVVRTIVPEVIRFDEEGAGEKFGIVVEWDGVWPKRSVPESLLDCERMATRIGEVTVLLAENENVLRARTAMQLM